MGSPEVKPVKVRARAVLAAILPLAVHVIRPDAAVAGQTPAALAGVLVTPQLPRLAVVVVKLVWVAR